MKSSPICNSIRYCSPADPMVPKLSDLSTNVKDRSPDEPIARGASESSRFQDYSALLSGPQRNIQPSGGIGFQVRWQVPSPGPGQRPKREELLRLRFSPCLCIPPQP